MPPKTKTKPVERNRSTLTLDDAPPPNKKPRLASVAKPPMFNLGSSQTKTSSQSPRSTPASSASQRATGLRLNNIDSVIDLTMDDDMPKPQSKVKVKAKVPKEPAGEDDRLWVEKYAPITEAELAVHKRKVEDVRRWLGEAFSDQAIAKYRRLLVLSGPAGSAKTATLTVLAREMGFSINEWVPAFAGSTNFEELEFDDVHESAMDKFEAFLGRAGHYTSLFSQPTSGTSSASAKKTATQRGTYAGRSVVLLEDLPNILHPSTRARFHTAIQRHATSSPVPVIVIVSDAGVRAEAEEPGTTSSRWTRGTADDAVSSRTVIPPGLGAAHVTEIGFNPVAPTYLTSALKKIRERAGAQKLVTDIALANIVTGAAGDVRAGVMALEFACNRAKGAGRRSKDANPGTDIESTTRRENALVLFHLLGKVLYNKRKGDPPPTAATKRDIAALREIDARLQDEPSLPEWLSKRETRKTSRVDVDDLYASTPIDASLFGLYVHQNYTAFCSEIDQCDALVDNLSWLDANGGDNWYEQNPYSFHLNALGTLHALPCPVPRTGQKFCKPAFFGNGKREHEAVAAVERVRTWLADGALAPASPWTRTTVALELGGVFRASKLRPPKEHRLFSELVFGEGEDGAEEADEHETGRDVDALDEDEKLIRRDIWGDEEVQGTMVEGDDIDEF